MRRRREMQQPYLDLLDEEYGERMTITRLPLLAREVKGIDRLRRIEGLLFADGRSEER
jgi:anion-transporting  ArsA/GET3 family ATPase